MTHVLPSTGSISSNHRLVNPAGKRFQAAALRSRADPPGAGWTPVLTELPRWGAAVEARGDPALDKHSIGLGAHRLESDAGDRMRLPGFGA